MKIDAKQWAMHKKETKFPIAEQCNVELHIAGAGPLVVYGISDEGECPLKAGSDYLHFKSNMSNFSQVKVTGKEFGLTAKVNGMQADEPRDNEPPVPPRESNNILQKLRNRARAEMQLTREHFENDTGLPGYEMDDDAPEQFEEEDAIDARQASLADQNAGEGDRPATVADGQASEPGDNQGSSADDQTPNGDSEKD